MEYFVLIQAGPTPQGLYKNGVNNTGNNTGNANGGSYPMRLAPSAPEEYPAQREKKML